MLAQRKRRDTFFAIVLACLFAAFVSYLCVHPYLVGAVPNTSSSAGEDFFDGWTTEDGSPVLLNKLGAIEGFWERGVTIQKRLPNSLDSRMELNFVTVNLSIHLYYEGVEAYSFDPPRAPGETPYATRFNFAPLAPSDAGKLVTIKLQPFYADMGSRLEDMRISQTSTYIQGYVRTHFVAFAESVLIAFIGLAVFGLEFALRKTDHGELDLLALGGVAFLLGTWSGTVTGVTQITTGLTSLIGALEYLSLLFVPYPILRFTSSILLPPQRKRFDMLAGVLAAMAIAVSAILCVGFGADMHSILRVSHVHLGICGVLIIVQVVVSLHAHGVDVFKEALASNNAMAIAFFIFVACGIIDFLRFVTPLNVPGDAALFIRHGLFAFVVVLAIEAARASFAYITRAKYADTIEVMAFTDALTNLGNRAAWKVMRDEVESSLKVGTLEDAIICQFDVNFLKRVNDTYGHAAGDRYIKHAANTIQRSFGMEGTCYRTGGDEFTAIIIGDALDERLNECRQLFEVSMDEQNVAREGDVSLSMALGVAHVTETETRTLRAAQSIADERMYDNKRAMKAERRD
ncbi:MAG: GGDEF domain-containing protein [Atopobiaceae bacterium]|nr:GGDEF domain-containing protein [Atopobiaceae bacterium]